MTSPTVSAEFGTIRPGDLLSDREAWELHQKMERAGLEAESARLRAHFVAERTGNSVEGVLRQIAAHIATSSQTTKEAMALAVAASERASAVVDKSAEANLRLAKAEEDRIAIDREMRSASAELAKLAAERDAEADKLRSQRFALIITSVVGPLVVGVLALLQILSGGTP